MAGQFFGALGDDLAAASGDELRALLEQVDITVPRRTQGRRSEHIERYCVVHYLRTLERNGLLRFPFRISKDDPPDFVVEMGSERFGLEVTEAGDPEHQRAMTALETAPRGSVVVGGSVREPGKPARSWPYAGDEPERFWTAEVLARIKKKTEQLAAYASLPEECLLVYDNTEYGPLTAWTVTELPSRLATAIDEWRIAEPGHRRHFSRISVLRDRVLMYDVTGDAFLLPVPPSSALPVLLPLTRLPGVSEEDLQEFCRSHHIRKLGFFGSVREAERFGPDSDVDVLVEFEPSHRIGLMGLARVELELSRLLSRKADLRTVPDLSRYFREEVVREKTDLAYVAG
jgi:predicted nucleotidyltransferase